MTDERHRMTVPELLEELQRRGITAEREGIYRDIDALIQYGADRYGVLSRQRRAFKG